MPREARGYHALALALALALGVSFVVAWALWVDSQERGPAESGPRIQTTGGLSSREARHGPTLNGLAPRASEREKSAAQADALHSPDPQRVPLTVEIVDATTGRVIDAEWRRGLSDEALHDNWTFAQQDSAIPVPRGPATVGVRIEQSIGVRLPAGYAHWHTPVLDSPLAFRAKRVTYTHPVWPMADVRLEISDFPDSTWGALHLRASLDGIGLAVSWESDSPTLRLRGVPYIPGATLVIVGMRYDVRRALEGRTEVPYDLNAYAWRGEVPSSRDTCLRATLAWGRSPTEHDEWSQANDERSLMLARQIFGRTWTAPLASATSAQDRSGRIRVRLLDSDGQGMAGARVEALGGEEAGEHWYASAACDTDGIAMLTGLTQGRWLVRSDEYGVNEASSRVAVAKGGTSDVTLREPSGGTVNLVVVESDGEPARFASLMFDGILKAWCDVAPDRTQRMDTYVDFSGRRTLTRVPAGVHTLRAALGRRQAEAEVEVRDGEAIEVRVALPSYQKASEE